MNTYQQLKNERQEKYNKLFSELGVFYAFSNEQFSEGKALHPLREGEKYASMGMGGYIRNSQLDKLFAGIKVIDDWFSTENKKIKQDKAEKEKAILYELCNYECFYSGDIFGGDAWQVLKEQGYTKQEVLSVYKKNYQLRTASL